MTLHIDDANAYRRSGDDPWFKIVGAAAASCFVGALVADIVYVQAPDMVWVTFSVWLITIGLVIALVATLVGLVDRVVHRRLGLVASLWPYLVGFAAVVIVEIFNAFIHSRDAYQAVVPEGIALSAVSVILLLVTPVLARARLRSTPRKAPL